jgi:hypothetical protein
MTKPPIGDILVILLEEVICVFVAISDGGRKNIGVLP